MKKNLIPLVIGLSLATTVSLSAQTLTRYTSSPGSKVKIDGTSNIHDWTVEGAVVSGYFEVDKAALEKAAPGKLNAAVEVKIPVRSLKSGKEKMDEVMQEHMTMDKFPMINYKLSELKIVKGAAGKVECESQGELFVSGATNKITMPVTIEKAEGEKIKVTGAIPLKMTAFNIKPPQPALAMGLIKTGDDVKIAIEWMVAEKK